MKAIKIISLSFFLLSTLLFFDNLRRQNYFEEIVDQYTRTISHLGTVDSALRLDLKKKYDIDIKCEHSCSAYIGESITVIFTKNNYLVNTNVVMNTFTSERYIIMGLLY